MPFPLKVLLWIIMFISTLGLLVGTLNLMNPSAVHIPFGPNGESAEGMDGVIASVLSSAVIGIILGIPAALLTWLVGSKTSGKRKTRDSSNG